MQHKQRDTRKTRPGHYFGLKFQSGYLFFNVIGTEYVELKPFILKNENGNRAEIAAQTAGDEDDRLHDPNEVPLIEPEDEDRNLFFHIMYGIEPSRMQVFQRYGRDRNESLINYDEPGDPAPITNGFDSPYNNPSRESEFIVANDMSQPKLQAYNPMDEPAEARLSIHITKLRFAVIDDPGTQRALLQGQIPSRIMMVGGGAQDGDQTKAPSWVTSTFGDELRSAQEILTTSDADTGGGNQGGAGGVVGGGGNIPGQGDLR
jgi:hypothetical protein